MNLLYAMHDSDENLKARGCRLLAGPDEAKQAERKGYGIFWTVNRFKAGVRRIENLEAITAWAVDLDAGTKAGMRAKLNSSPLVPSLVVETARGYHAYWKAKEGAKAEHWNALVLDRLVPFFGADKNARDIARILRAPGYLHQKDPTKPFLIREVHQHNVSYSEDQIARAFPCIKKPEIKRRRETEDPKHGTGGFWDRVYALDCEEALSQLGGQLGESYTFRQTSRGSRNIYVDGKSTSCWVDANGRIGSLSDGGPTIYNWITWLGYSPKDAVDMIKRAFPGIDHE